MNLSYDGNPVFMFLLVIVLPVICSSVVWCIDEAERRSKKRKARRAPVVLEHPPTLAEQEAAAQRAFGD